jgi:hypothetical protein
MSSDDFILRDLSSDMDQGEREALLPIASRLQASRPTPTLDFRQELWTKLRHQPRRTPARRLTRANYQALAAAYTTVGTLLLAVAALGLAGSGPFAPS